MSTSEDLRLDESVVLNRPLNGRAVKLILVRTVFAGGISVVLEPLKSDFK